MASTVNIIYKRYVPQVIILRYSPIRCASTDVSESTSQNFPKIRSDIPTLRRGTGGRSSFSGNIATVFGASGTLGRALVNQLGKIGTQVIVPYRSDAYNTRRLKLCGDLGQILFTPFFLKDEESLYKAMKHSNIVINLIGRDYETPNFTFKDVHVTGARNIARIAKECGVQTLVHVSALNACQKPHPIILKKGSGFYSSKWEGEQAVREEFPEVIIFRPSDIWGVNDNFLNYYMSWVRRTWRLMSVWNRGIGIIKQPVYFSDVAKGIIKSIQDPDAIGQTYQAIGPYRYELSELLDWMHRVAKRTAESWYYRVDIRFDLTFWAKLYFAEIFMARFRKLSWERLEREATTDVIDPKLPELRDLGINLTDMESRIFWELKYYRLHAYNDPLLKTYIRPVEPCPHVQG